MSLSLASRCLNRFHFEHNHTNLKTELLAGLTTFLTMAYAVIVNPLVLSKSGMDAGAIFTATCVITALGCVLIGLMANYPTAIGPSMAMNVYFVAELVDHLGFAWQQALSIVAITGMIIAVLAKLRIRTWLEKALPDSLKQATSAGIGLFIGVIAIKFSGSLSETGHWYQHLQWAQLGLFAGGAILIYVLNHKRILGGTVIGIAVVSIIGSFFHPLNIQHVFSMPPSMLPTFSQWQWHGLVNGTALTAIASLVLVSTFDCTATLNGLLHDTHLMKEPKIRHRMRRALYANGLATYAGAASGLSNMNPFFESASGIHSGGRTGFTSIVVAGFFLLCLFFSPLVKAIPAYATSAALFFVAFCMSHRIRQINWRVWRDALPSAVTLIMIPASFSIADGIGYGLGSYILVNLLSGETKAISRDTWILTAIFAAYAGARLL